MERMEAESSSVALATAWTFSVAWPEACVTEVERRVVADMQHLMRLHPGGLRGGVKNARIGLADAKLPGADAGLEIRRNANLPDVSVAVGQRHHRKTARQKRQPRQRVVKQRDAVALGKKHLKGRLGQ